MTRVLRTLFFWLLLGRTLFAGGVHPENTWDYSVQVTAQVTAQPAPRITLQWEPDSQGSATGYIIYRKTPGENVWGPGRKLASTATSFTDGTVEVGLAYEYRVVKLTRDYTGYGYIQSGIAVPLTEDRGTVLLMIEQAHAAALAPELARLEEDLVGDGWSVRRHLVDRSDSVVSVKARILADYAAAPAKVKSVFLVGHVPVPYSGKFAPDAHPDHVGAWPADVYYGDMTGEWTDTSVNYRQTMNHDSNDAKRQGNVPGDGKFDQSTIPGVVALAVGRVDFANLPGRSGKAGEGTFLSEVELLRQYLNKDHAFRHAQTRVQSRALVGDYFGLRGGEAFAASGHRSFAPLVGSANVDNLNLNAGQGRGQWISKLASQNYLVAYGCGLGSYRTIEGLGRSGPQDEGDAEELVRKDVRAVFTLVYGSWLGDWDSEDNFMRAILAAPTCTLTAAWSGRPHWFMHPMALGETIGYVTRLTQNNFSLYQNQINGCVRQTHIALMGDPTLRLQSVGPAKKIIGRNVLDNLILSWQASSDTVVGYHVYRAPADGGEYVRLTSAPIVQTNFSVRNFEAGASYMVRAVKLETSPSGTYYNASQGIFWRSDNSTTPASDRVAGVASLQ